MTINIRFDFQFYTITTTITLKSLITKKINDVQLYDKINFKYYCKNFQNNIKYFNLKFIFNNLVYIMHNKIFYK